MICIKCEKNIRFLEDIHGLPTPQGRVLCLKCAKYDLSGPK